MNLGTFARSKARPVPTGVLARIAATGIYLLRGISRDLQRAARARAALRPLASLARVRGGNLDTPAR